MPTYSIQGLVAVDKYLGEVEAPNAQEAIAKAWRDLDTGAPNVCHACSHEMNVGDVYSLIATNVDNSDDTAESEE